MAANDRIQGWSRVREWLKPFVGPDATLTARLQIMEGRCQNLVRTLPGLVHDELKPEDVNTDGEDHAPDALRYELMSRPAPKPIPVVNARQILTSPRPSRWSRNGASGRDISGTSTSWLNSSAARAPPCADYVEPR